MRIAYFANRTGNGLYRCVGPLSSLAVFGGHDVRELPTDPRLPAPTAGVADVDVLHIHRCCDARVQELARAAKAQGAAVIWDNDDDIGAIPRNVPTRRRLGGYAWDRRVVDMQRLFRHVDLVTTPSRVLAERLLEVGAPRTAVVENYVFDHFLRPSRPPHAGVTIGWVAGLEHQADAERLPIRAVLQELLDTRPDVNVETIGLRLGLRSERYVHNDGVELEHLCDHVARFDVGIAPLSDIPFNRSRSNIKVKEYAAAGTPWLASPTGPYAQLGEKQGGRLVADDAWLPALTRLIDKPRERRKLARNALRWASGETLSKNVHVWEAILRDAIDQAAGQPTALAG